MTDIRTLIREILAEEISGLRAELAGGQIESVRVGTIEDLTRFAQSVLNRAADPGFAAALCEGRLRFAPDPAAQTASAPIMPTCAEPRPQPAKIVTTHPAPVPALNKPLVTERDIAALAEGETRLRVARATRLTPLATDEARRRGIRIERTPT
ncbi:MAG: hypothetical protein KDE03_01040 [Rhodobacteraceae bacterium]|nr:hypothetical protein [Paracoccaceae bacterium]